MDQTDASPIASYRLTEADMTAALISYWNRRGGPHLWALVFFAILAVVLGVYVLWQVGQNNAKIGGTTFIAFLAGMLVQGSFLGFCIWHNQRKLAAETWPLYMAVPSPLKLYQNPDGLRWFAEGYDRVIRWLDVRTMLLTPDKKVWVVEAFGIVYWVPLSAFCDAEEFEAFIEWAWHVWKSTRPTGRAFEVLPKPRSNSPA